MKIGLLGTRGVPARYGGFETAAEEIGSRLAAYGHHVVVYCRNPGQQLTAYRGMELVNLPAIRSKSLETLSIRRSPRSMPWSAAAPTSS